MEIAFKGMGRGALAAEIGLPLLVLWRRTRKPARVRAGRVQRLHRRLRARVRFASTNIAFLLLFFQPRTHALGAAAGVSSATARWKGSPG
jgi:hypothetical protein